MRYALDHLAAIEPRLAYLTVSVAARPQGETPRITLDGRALGPAAWGVAIPVDAGRHEALAEGRRWRATIDIRDGEHRQIEVPARLEADTASGAAPRSARRGSPRASVEGPADKSLLAARAANPEPAGRNRRARVVELALGGAGLAAVGVGTYFGWRASDLWSQRNRACPMEACTNRGRAARLTRGRGGNRRHLDDGRWHRRTRGSGVGVPVAALRVAHVGAGVHPGLAAPARWRAPRRAGAADDGRIVLKRQSRRAVLVLWMAAGGWLSAIGCQRFVGIHDSHVADGAAGTSGGGGVGDDAAGTGGGGASGTNGGTGGIGSGTAGNSSGGGNSSNGGGRGGVGEAGGSGLGGAPSDAGAGTGGGATDGGGSGGTTAGATCSAPWHAENVPARLLNTPGMTACSILPSAVPTLAAGVDAANFRGAQACGACIRVQAALGPTSVVVPIVELSMATGILLTKAAMTRSPPGPA